jgi:hypothetical protein
LCLSLQGRLSGSERLPFDQGAEPRLRRQKERLPKREPLSGNLFVSLFYPTAFDSEIHIYGKRRADNADKENA